MVGEASEKTDGQGCAHCEVSDDVQLVRVQHAGLDVKRWVLPEHHEAIVIDLSQRGAAESLVESLVGDRYRFLEVLGRGGMGVVIKAHDSLLNRVVAIKMLAGELEQNEEAQRIFLEEARSLAPLSHPNLVAIHDIQHLQGHTLMVLEFVVGQNLDKRLQVEGPVPIDTVLRYVIQMARAASFMHSKGFIHRDLKPGNVIVGDNDAVKIIDFGLARSLDQISMKGTQIRGTPAYMAPEQIRGLDLTAKVDTYQLGVTIYELLTGELPFSGDMGYAHVHKTPPALVEVMPGISPELSGLVAACLAKDPEARPTARELLDELQALYVITADEISDAIQEVERLSGDRISDWRRTTSGRFSAPAPQEDEPKRRGAWVVPLIVVLMLFAGGGLALYLAGRTAQTPSAEEVAAPIAPTAVDEAPPASPPPPRVDEVRAVPLPDAGASEPAPARLFEAAAPRLVPTPRVVERPPQPKPAPTRVESASEREPEAATTPKRSSAPAIRTTRRSGGSDEPTQAKPPKSSDIRLSR